MRILCHISLILKHCYLYCDLKFRIFSCIIRYHHEMWMRYRFLNQQFGNICKCPKKSKQIIQAKFFRESFSALVKCQVKESGRPWPTTSRGCRVECARGRRASPTSRTSTTQISTTRGRGKKGTIKIRLGK